MAMTKKFGNERLTVHGEKPGKPAYDDQRKADNEKNHGSVYKGYPMGKKGQR